jgi:hypothetical protein
VTVSVNPALAFAFGGFAGDRSVSPKPPLGGGAVSKSLSNVPLRGPDRAASCIAQTKGPQAEDIFGTNYWAAFVEQRSQQGVESAGDGTWRPK